MIYEVCVLLWICYLDLVAIEDALDLHNWNDDYKWKHIFSEDI